MRFAFVLLSTTLLLGGVPAEPTPSIRKVEVSVQDATITVQGWWKAPGNPDSAVVTLSGGSAEMQRKAVRGEVTTTSFVVSRPAAGTTVGGQFCVLTTKASWVSAPAACRAWSWTAPAVLPPPVIDSVRADTTLVAGNLIPSSLTMTAPETRVMCMIYTMENGERLYRGPRMFECDVLATANPTPASQAWIDANACTTWNVVAVDAQGRTLTAAPTQPCAGSAVVEGR